MVIQPVFNLVGCWPGALQMVLSDSLQGFFLIGILQLFSILRTVMARIFVIALAVVDTAHLRMGIFAAFILHLLSFSLVFLLDLSLLIPSIPAEQLEHAGLVVPRPVDHTEDSLLIPYVD